MQKSFEKISGDTEGVAYEFPVYRIKGASPGAPSAYLQAALHGGELPGVVAIDALMPKLRAGGSRGADQRRHHHRAMGQSDRPRAISLRRSAGPLPSRHTRQLQSRFSAARAAGPALFRPTDMPATADRRLKARLLSCRSATTSCSTCIATTRACRISTCRRAVASDGRLRRRYGRRSGDDWEGRGRRRVRGGARSIPIWASGQRDARAPRRDHGRVARPRRRRTAPRPVRRRGLYRLLVRAARSRTPRSRRRRHSPALPRRSTMSR